MIRRFICWLKGHGNLFVLSIDSSERRTTYLCRDCHATWNEYEGRR